MWACRAENVLVDGRYEHDASVTEVIRPAPIVPEESGRAILAAMLRHTVEAGGLWLPQPTRWNRYDRPWPAPDDPGEAHLLGSISVAYGTPTKYQITVYRVMITYAGAAQGWSVQAVCDEALGFGDLSLAKCPRAALTPPPKPFRH